MGLLGASQSTIPGLQVPLDSDRPLNQYSSGNNDTPHPPAGNLTTTTTTTGIHPVTQPIFDPATLGAPHGNPGSDTLGLNLTNVLPSPNPSWPPQWLSSEEAPWSAVSGRDVQEAGPSNGWRPENCVQGEVTRWGMFPE